MILHNSTSILITIRFQKFGSSYIEYIPNDEQKAIEKGESLRFTLNDLVFGKYVGYTSDKTTPFYDCYIKRRGTLYTTLKNAVKVADKKAQYDECAKRLLGQKIILAHILAKTVKEFRGMKPEEVVSYIEGEPYIRAVPIDSGMTNIWDSEQQIVGLNTENQEVLEGLIRFDIIFYVRRMNRLSQIIINVEAQKDEHDKYDILNRAIFYVCRLISSQKERDFSGSNYNDIKQVYSIWICMNMKDNVMNHIAMSDRKIIGDYDWKGNLDLTNTIMIGLAKRIPEHTEQYELHRLLGALLSDEMSVNKKIGIIEQEYDISTEENAEEEMKIMCNLGQGIEDRGIEKGEERMGRLINKLMELNCQDDIKKVISDRLYRKKLFEKFEI